MTKEYYLQNVDSIVLRKESDASPLLRTPYRSASLWVPLGNSGLNRKLERPEAYYSMDEFTGLRPAWHRNSSWEIGPPDLQERNYDGGSTEILSTDGVQSRGQAALFAAGQYLTTRFVEMFDDRIAINFHAKIDTAAITTLGAPIVVLAPPQSNRRVPNHDPGNFFGVGIVKVGSNYHFRVVAGYLFETGFAWVDSVTADNVNVAANTFYQVCAYTSHELEANGTVVNRKLNLSVNNQPVSADRTDGLYFVQSTPHLYVAENPVLVAFGELSDAPSSLAVDKLCIWQAADIGANERETLFNGGRGYDPTVPLLDSLIAFWEMDEALGEDRQDQTGRYLLRDVHGSVGQAAGLFGNCADFTESDEVYLATRPPALSWQGFAFAGFVKLDDVSTKSNHVILNWLKTEGGLHYGFKLQFEVDAGFILEVGDGTSTLKTVATGDPPIAAGDWNLVSFGALSNGAVGNGTIWVALNNDDVETADGFPAVHNGEMQWGRDYDGVGEECLDGKLDAWGFYTGLTSADRALLHSQISYPF